MALHAALNSSHTEEQPQPSPPLPSVPNVWDDVAAIEGSAPNVDSGDDNLAHSQGDQNMAVAGSGHLVDNSADYAQGGDDTDMEHDAMLLVLHAMQRRSSERGEAAGQGQDRGVVRQNEQALRADTSRDTSSDEQYWRAVEAAGEAAFVNGTEGDELPDLDADWGSLG